MFKIGDVVKFLDNDIGVSDPTRHYVEGCGLSMDATYTLKKLGGSGKCWFLDEAGCYAFDERRLEHVGGPW